MSEQKQWKSELNSRAPVPSLPCERYCLSQLQLGQCSARSCPSSPAERSRSWPPAPHENRHYSNWLVTNIHITLFTLTLLHYQTRNAPWTPNTARKGTPSRPQLRSSTQTSRVCIGIRCSFVRDRRATRHTRTVEVISTSTHTNRRSVKSSALTKIHHRMRGYARLARRMNLRAVLSSNDVARKPGTR